MFRLAECQQKFISRWLLLMMYSNNTICSNKTKKTKTESQSKKYCCFCVLEWKETLFSFPFMTSLLRIKCSPGNFIWQDVTRVGVNPKKCVVNSNATAVLSIAQFTPPNLKSKLSQVKFPLNSNQLNKLLHSPRRCILLFRAGNFAEVNNEMHRKATVIALVNSFKFHEWAT